jgi:phytoene synthase
LRYFALLYTPNEHRDALSALFVIDTELRDSAASASHDVAHTRLQWWRAEIDRLVNDNPQHPATRLLNRQRPSDRIAFSMLHELVAAADMDLARMTYVNSQELRAYCARSSGALMEAIARQLSPEPAVPEPLRAAINRIGIGIRQAEIVRDLRQDAHDARVYVPLDELERLNLTREQLDQPVTSPSARTAIRSIHEDALTNLSKPAIDDTWNDALRPIWVLAALHRRLLERIAKLDFNVGAARVELGTIEKPWIAWRAARSRL